MTRIDLPTDVSAPDVSASVAPPPNRSVLEATRALDGILKFYRPLAGQIRSKAECLRLIDGRGPAGVLEALAGLSPEWADHAIASVVSHA